MNRPSFVFTPISEAVVLSRLQHLPLHKVSSDRLMANRLLRETTSLIASSITYIFNLFLNISQFPDEWKVAAVCPLFKQRGQPDAPTNCRPVSPLPAIVKLMDSIQSDALCGYLV